MELQLITYQNIKKIRALDEYKYNILDLSDERLWYSDYYGDLVYQKDYQHIGTMIANARSNVIIKLPQNIIAKKYNITKKQYLNNEELKNRKSKILDVLKTLWNIPFNIEYEIVRFKFDDVECDADFYFTNIPEDWIIAESMKSKKPVIINYRNVYLTTLDIDSSNNQKLIDLIDLKNSDVEESIPDWVYDIDYKNQLELRGRVSEINQEIGRLKNEQGKVLVEQNNLIDTMKILYTTGRELEHSVNKILCELLDTDISTFKDSGNEDFLFENENIRLIFEAKGVTKNLEKKFLSQLLANSHHFDDTKKTKPILIICHNRDKPLISRDELHPDNLALAEKYDEIVITTEDLLKIYENNISKEKILQIITSSVGQVTINDFL